MTSIHKLVKELIFEIVTKKPQEFMYTTTHGKKPYTYSIYEKDTPLTLVTNVNGKNETKHIIYPGNIILTGPKKETWGMTFHSFMERYNIINGKAIPLPILRKAACVSKEIFKKHNLPNPYPFEAPWKETMYLEPNDYLIKDSNGYYRVEKKIFKETYIVY
jgi:hypothetical protein